MLKIEVKPREGTDQIETLIESSGPLADIVSELGIAVRRMHAGILDTHPIAGFQFMRALQKMFSDPDFWTYDRKAKLLSLTHLLSQIQGRKNNNGPHGPGGPRR